MDLGDRESSEKISDGSKSFGLVSARSEKQARSESSGNTIKECNCVLPWYLVTTLDPEKKKHN